MRRVSISGMLISFGLIVGLGIALSIGLQQLAMSRLKVGGPVYKDVIEGKDLVADILPPPLFLVEGYSLASEAAIDMRVDAIDNTSREQSVGLNEISTAVNAIDQMTQQNTAMVEETTAISHSLEADAGDLAELVGMFKLNRRSAVRDPDVHHARRKVAA